MTRYGDCSITRGYKSRHVGTDGGLGVPPRYKFSPFQERACPELAEGKGAWGMVRKDIRRSQV